jgi:hypothetical protein
VIRIGIVAHTSRADAAHELFATVGASFLSMDNGRLGCDGNHDRVHRWLVSQPSVWSVVLEDDAVPVPDFKAQLEACLEHSPEPLVSLYLGQSRPPQYQVAIGRAVEAAQRDGADWVSADRLYHGVGYAVRTDLLPGLVGWRMGLPVDERISEWASWSGLDVSYCVPSLVDHADWPTVIAVHNDGQPRPAGRVAWSAGAHADWSSKSVWVDQ